MKRRGLKLLIGVSAAFLAVALPAGPASAQSGLGTRLDEAGQKLDSDMQSCREVNLAEYATLLNEAMANKQRAAKAAKKGIPVDQAQVDSDVGKASMLFARAQAAQATQCMRAAQRAQPPAQTSPQSTGMAPSAPPATRPAGVTSQDEQAVARQQRTIEDFEASLDEVQSLVKAGKCKAAWDLVDDLDDWLDDLDRPARVTPVVPADYRPRVPARLIDEWDARIDELIKDCPRPGTLDYKQVRLIIDTHNAERAQYGLEPFRWSPKLELHALDYANELKRTGQLAHAPREGRGTERENLSQGLPWWSVQQHLDAWRQEKKKFKPGIFPNVSFTGNWFEVGHWTQWIWENTTAVGCAMVVGGPASWFVCRYNPGGNKDGVPVGFPRKAGNAPVSTAQIGQQQERSGGNRWIRPRLIGGDYGGSDFNPDNFGESLSFSDGELAAIGGGGSLGSVDIREFDSWLNGSSGGAEDVPIGGFVGSGVGVGRVDWVTARVFGAFDSGDIGGPIDIPASPEDQRTRLEMPVLSHYRAPVPPDPTFDPSNPPDDVSAYVGFFHAQAAYRAARAGSDVGGMLLAQAQMRAAIAQYNELIDAAISAGDLSKVKPSSLRYIHDLMVDEYGKTTAPEEPDTKVVQPELPNKEPFKTPEPKAGDLDPG